MKLLLALLLLSFNAYAQIVIDPNLDATYDVVCTPPTLRENGAPLNAGEITGYLYNIGTAKGVYTEQIKTTVCSLTVDATALADGDYFYAVNALEINGYDSVYSQEFDVTILRGSNANPPTQIRIENCNNCTITVQ